MGLKWPQLNSTHKTTQKMVSRPLLTQEHTWPSDKSTCRFFFSKCVKPHLKPCIFLDTRKTIENFSKMGYACIYILQGAIGSWIWSILAIWRKMTIFKVIYVPWKRERQFNFNFFYLKFSLIQDAKKIFLNTFVFWPQSLVILVNVIKRVQCWPFTPPLEVEMRSKKIKWH